MHLGHSSGRSNGLLFVLAGGLLAACGGSGLERAGQAAAGGAPGSAGAGGAVCADGSERCPCYGNNTCDTGLTCASGMCVSLGSGGSSSGGAGGAPEASGGTSGQGQGGVPGMGGMATGGSPDGGQSPTGGTGAAGGPAATGGSPDGGQPPASTGGSVGTGGSATGGSAPVGGSPPGTGGSPAGGQSTGGSGGIPQCRVNGVNQACLPVCGDGNHDPSEGCDDGNLLDGDGCSSRCTVETGFGCADRKESSARPCPTNPSLSCLVLPVTFRDFDGQHLPSGHPDFLYYGAPSSSPNPSGHTTGVSPGASMTTCVPNASGTKVAWSAGQACPSGETVGPCLGIAQSTLGSTGKPVLGTSSCPCSYTDWDNTGLYGTCPASGACTPSAGLSGVGDCYVSGGSGTHHLHIETTVRVVESDMSFAQWYTDSSFSHAVEGSLELAATSGGQYQFSSSTPGAPAGAAGSTVADDIHAIFMGTQTTLTSGFFPLENESRPKVCNIWPYWVSNPSCMAGSGYPVPSQWDVSGSYVAHTPGTGGPVAPVIGMTRNFYFTTEAHYFFRYDGVGGTVSVNGDDDLWVFINGHLALDLGGPHTRTQLSAPINATYGLTAGYVYDLAVFHADRHPRESNFQLSLPDFGTMRSVCQPQ